MGMRGPKPKPIAERFWAKVDRREKGCWPWLGAMNRLHGNGMFTMYVDAVDGGKAMRPVAAYRMAWMLTHGVIPPGKHILHSCDNRRCVRPDHLRLGTHRENMREAAERGLLGPKITKITAETVRRMREAYVADPSLSCGQLARRYGINHEYVRGIMLGKHWRKAGGPMGITKPQRGQIVRTAKLTEAGVREIIRLHGSGQKTRRELAKEFRVGVTAIFNVTTRKSWKHVQTG